MSFPYNNDKQFLNYQLKWMGIYIPMGAAIALVLPFPVSLLVALGAFVLLNFIRARRMLKRGQSILVTEGGNNSSSAEQQENATAMLVDLNGVRPDDPRSSTGVAFFSTNSTGQLAFLDKMIAINQVKASPEGTAIRMWEWKGADLPFRNEADGVTATIGNQTTTTIPDTLQERR